jgi:O-succinylbenzoic acid--CoA ligase
MQTLVLGPPAPASASAPAFVDGQAAELLTVLERHWQAGACVALVAAADELLLQAELGPGGAPALAAHGAAVLLGSGGSSGGRRWCLQPLAHLQASADATGLWLAGLGLDPAACLHLNPLPLHHVSGLMPLVRVRRWGAELACLAPALLRDPAALVEAVPLPSDRPVLLSLVPTQLRRLLAVPAAVAWLRRCAVIWVGGAALDADLAARARSEALPLAPCYGATETAAMVAALAPSQFLAGAGGCGAPLADVELRALAGRGVLEVRTARLAPGWLENGTLRPLPLAAGGWWRSGDAGRCDSGGLLVHGRWDGAISSGGETVFPEQLEERLRRQAAAAGLPLAAVLLLAETDPEWGERLVALVRPATSDEPEAALMVALAGLVATWPAAERPRRWQLCPELAPSALGKWQRQRWRRWLDAQGRQVRYQPAEP